MPILRRLASEERGVTIILVALMLLVLLGFAAMAIDVGELLWNRRALQNAVDAAALAGVRELPSNPPLAQQVALDYAAANGFSNASGQVSVTAAISTIFNPNDSLVVTAVRKRPPLFRWAVGGGDVDVPAQAVAIVAQVEPPCDLWPWGVEEYVVPFTDTTRSQLMVYSDTYGMQVVLKVPDSQEVAPGNFLAIDLDADKHGGARAYEDTIKWKGCLPIGQLYTEPGNMVGPTEQGVEKDVDSAIRQCVPDWDPKKGGLPLDCVHWQLDASNPVGRPYGIGCPNDGNIMGTYGGHSCGYCTEPSDEEPYPIVHKVNGRFCGRVGIIPILAPGTFSTVSALAEKDPHGKFPVTAVSYAAFYLIGLVKEPPGNQAYVVGAFLETVSEQGAPRYRLPLEGPVGYFLWR